MIEVEFEQGGELVLIHMTKGLLVMPRSVFIESLKRGKGYRRRTALESRLSAQLGDSEFRYAPQAVQSASAERAQHARRAEIEAIPRMGDHAFHQPPQAVSLAGGNDTVCESEAEREAPDPIKERSMTPLVITAGPVSLVVQPPSAHLLVEVLADQLTASARLVGVDDLMLPPARSQLIALQVKSEWLGYRSYQEAGNPRIEKARLQLELDTCPSTLSQEQVATVTKALGQTVSHMGPELSAKQVVVLRRSCNQLLSHYSPELNVRGR